MRGCDDLIPDSLIFPTWRTFQLEKTKDFGVFGKCSEVVSTVLYWHKKITSGILAVSA